MLLGANGSGKSTLLRLIAKLIPLQEGIIIAPQPVGFVFQNPDHQLVMPTAGADVAFGLVAENLTLAQTHTRVRSALDAVGLGGLERRPVYALSGGQKQRLAVAGMVARQCQVLLLDEPTALLDPESQTALLELVRQLVRQQGVAALWVTHRLGELEYCDGAVLLQGGKVAAQGDPEKLVGLLKV